ncbi:MAG TPA: right-handed parallel beta-helix repeat-containing protein [Chthoniobacteraceae bacterium]|nr:right-handed parallel beta-helix repeat-containing protein [Chthoniobacteraceae bacterium]
MFPLRHFLKPFPSLIAAACCATSLPARAADIAVSTDSELHAALKAAKPGDHLRLGAGPFKGGFFSVGLHGTAEKPIRISGPSAENPAVFQAGQASGMQLVQAAYIEVENLHIARAAGSGLMFDDGGKEPFSCHHITIRHCRIDDVGPGGGACSIKLAGVADFSIRNCTFQDWGVGGDAVDGVGCRNGAVENCAFLAGRGAAAVQFKGGSEEVTIRRCVFHEAQGGGINVGGSTGMPYFRPKPLGFEARKITVEGNTFIGGAAAVIFANADGAVVRFNTIYLPKQWAFRILQQTPREDFTPCRNGRIEDNLIVFKSNWYEGGINVGPKTAPETFTFARNLWYCVDAPAKSTPVLPTKERDGVIGWDPGFANPAQGDFTVPAGSPAHGKGAGALPR